MHTLREKFVAAEAIPAGVPVFFDTDNYLIVDGTAAVPTYAAGDLFAGISVAACAAGEFCHIAPPGADALIELTDAGPWRPGDIVYFDQAGGISNAPTAGVDQAIARVKPILTSDGATVTTGGAGVYVAVTVLNGLPF